MTAEKRVAAEEPVETGRSITHACSLIGLGRASYYRQPKERREADFVVIAAINEVLARVLGTGFGECFTRMRWKGYCLNHKRVYRVYRRMGLNLPTRVKSKPQQNGFAERFNGSMRRDFLDAYLFDSLSQVREMAWV